MESRWYDIDKSRFHQILATRYDDGSYQIQLTKPPDMIPFLADAADFASRESILSAHHY